METAESSNNSTSSILSPDQDITKTVMENEQKTPTLKRCKLDSNEPSTSSQLKTTDNNTNALAEDKMTSASEHGSDGENCNITKTSFRFLKRNYRKRSNSSSSSTSSINSATNSHTTNQLEVNNTELNANANSRDNNADSNSNLENAFDNVQEETNSSIPSDSVSENSMFDNTNDSSSDGLMSDDCSSDSEISVETESKSTAALNRPMPKCDLSLVRNLMYRQAGIVYNGTQKTYDRSSNALTNRINGSIYSVERLSLLNKLEKHEGCVNCLNFNKTGNLLVTGSDDLHVIVWDWAKSTPIQTVRTGHTSNVFQSKFFDNGRYDNQTGFNLITSSRDGEVRQISVCPSGSVKTRQLVKHSRAIHKIAIPDTNQNEILTAGEDAVIIRIDLREKRPEKLLQVKVSDTDTRVPLYSIAAHPFDQEFCVCGRDKYVRVYDRRNLKENSKLFCPESLIKKKSNSVNITCAVYNYLGNEILASYSDENVYLFDNKNGTPGSFLHTYIGHKNTSTIKGVNFFGPCSEFVMSGSDCGHFFMWDKKTEAIVQWLPGDENGVVNCLEGHPTFPILATSGLDHDVKIWSPIKPDGRPSQTDLKKCIQKNMRRTDNAYFTDLNHSLLEYFVRHFSRRRNVLNSLPLRTEANTSSDDDFNFHRDLSDDDNHDDDGDDDDDDDDDVFTGPNENCTTS